MTFKKWFSRVDSILIRSIGIGVNDMRDRSWWDMWDSGMTPEEAIEEELGDLDSEEGIEEALCRELFG